MRKCLVCTRFEGNISLPNYSTTNTFTLVNNSRPSITTGVDNFGPLYVKNVYGQSDKTYKAWATLYMCASSREITLDLIPGMNPSVLKQSINRFIGRRGCPTNIINDNGKKFILQESEYVKY